MAKRSKLDSYLASIKPAASPRASAPARVLVDDPDSPRARAVMARDAANVRSRALDHANRLPVHAFGKDVGSLMRDRDGELLATVLVRGVGYADISDGGAVAMIDGSIIAERRASTAGGPPDRQWRVLARMGNVKRSRTSAVLAAWSAAHEAASVPARVSDAEATATADALAGAPVDSPTSRAFACRNTIDPSILLDRKRDVAASRTITLRNVAGIGIVVVHLGTDGAPDYAATATGQIVARYRRRSQSDAARRWWLDASISSSRQIAGCVATVLERAHASEPATAIGPASTRPVAVVSDDASTVDAPAPAAATVRPASADDGVCVMLKIARDAHHDAAEIERLALAEMQRGNVDAIAAWAAAAWLEGRAVTLFGANLSAALAAAAALRSACAQRLRAVGEMPRGVDVDLVMSAIGGAA